MSYGTQSQIDPESLVLIIGAGASSEVGLPLGAELKEHIARLLDIRYNAYVKVSGDAVIDGAFRLLSQHVDESQGDINPYLKASRHIRDAMPQAISIDNFIEAHRRNALIKDVGKLAIVRSILLAEQSSKLVELSASNYHTRFYSVRDTWFNLFFQVLTESCDVDGLEQRFARVAIVSFNYDRCLEHYLFHALMNYYRIGAARAASLLRHLKIYHPYGVVGKLPWMESGNGIEFGSDPKADQLVQLAKLIRTFEEGSNVEESDIERVRNVLAFASRIVFLGFAFHRANLELLFPPQIHGVPARRGVVFSTGFGISDPDSGVIRDQLYELAGLKPDSVRIAHGVKCAGLFTDYRQSLSFRRAR